MDKLVNWEDLVAMNVGVGVVREESAVNCGFLAWVAGRMMLSLTKKGNIEERSDLGGKISSDDVLIPGSQ